ncbi:MAG: hypothetical protein ACPIOQ_59230, partial [Promethearchaeia archaeon]
MREVEPEADSDVPVTNQLMPGAGVCPANLARAPRAHTRYAPMLEKTSVCDPCDAHTRRCHRLLLARGHRNER